VIYGWGSRAGYSSGDKANINYVGNYLKPNASSKTPDMAFNVGGKSTRIYVADNHLVGNEAANADNWKMIGSPKPESRVGHPFPIAAVKMDSAHEAYEKVLASAGATLPSRDVVDSRVVEQVRAGTGKILDSQREVGGWPQLRSGPAPLDSDGDGLPDDWEKRNGFNPASPADGAKDADGDGYTNLEEFLNGTPPRT
jgi:hypothetical protein